MQIRIGYELTFDCPQPTPMMCTLHVHPSRRSDLTIPDDVVADPSVPMKIYRDGFDNLCTRLVAPAGTIRLATDTVINDDGGPDRVVPGAKQIPAEALPEDTLVFLLGSRYCETDRLSQIAWDLFGKTPAGWPRVHAICDFVHRHITFGYEHARPTKTAWEAFQENNGVCRDYTHLAVTLCRCMNIPARYCTGYVSDIGQPPPYAVMDFAAWFEAYLEGGWHTFDPRNHAPRIGRILMARGRDAADVAISNSFGTTTLTGFKVITDEIARPESIAAVAP
jgi:transglutaminase-like putative cysteine protease